MNNTDDFKKDLLKWVSGQAQQWARVRQHDSRYTLEQRKYSEGCMLSFLAVESWVNSYRQKTQVDEKPRDNKKKFIVSLVSRWLLLTALLYGSIAILAVLMAMVLL